MLPLQWGAVIGASLGAAVFDFGSRRIPNFLTGPLFVSGLMWALMMGRWAGLVDGIVGSVLLAFPFLVLFVLAGGGAGDAKLMGAVGMWLGVLNSSVVLASVTLSGTILAVGFALLGGRFKAALENLASFSRAIVFFLFGQRKWNDTQAFLPQVNDMQTIPYGIAIFVGVCLAAGGLCLWRG
jgi:prepilin peptidase CpaA